MTFKMTKEIKFNANTWIVTYYFTRNNVQIHTIHTYKDTPEEVAEMRRLFNIIVFGNKDCTNATIVRIKN